MIEKNNSKKILINATNLHSGGAIQVAASFINEIILFEDVDFDVIVSSEVNNELKSIKTRVEQFHSYSVINTYGFSILFNYKFLRFILSYQTVFTIFGPLYILKNLEKSIVGFAQPWIVYPNNEIYRSYGFFNKLMARLKHSIQKYFYFKSDKLIVELDHVKEGLKGLTKNIDIVVVNNCISSIYSNSNKWASVNYIRSDHNTLLLGIIARDYPHKNLNILPDIAETLKSTYKMNVKFLVTLTDEEWLNRDSRFRSYIDNVGQLSVVQCPSFYNLLDGVIFPSLLECFSATPIEAMIMKKPVFASDRLFVKQVCGDFVKYINPIDPVDIAKIIYNYFLMGSNERLSFIESAYIQALRYNNPSERDKQYIQTIRRDIYK